MNGRTPPGVEIVSRSYRLPLELDEYLKAEGARRYGSAQGILIEAILEHRKIRGAIGDVVSAAMTPPVDPRQLTLPPYADGDGRPDARLVRGADVKAAAKKVAKAKAKKPTKPAKKGAKR